MTLEEYRKHIDGLSYDHPEWLAVIGWQHGQLKLIEQGKRVALPPDTKLVDAYYAEVVSQHKPKAVVAVLGEG